MPLSAVKDFAREQFEKANSFADSIKFANESLRKSMTLNRYDDVQASIADDPQLDGLEIGDGIAAWASVLAVDLRGSTRLADQLGARNTYLMTHTLLPTLVFVCEQESGTVMNLRGDGLFSAFGIEKSVDERLSALPDKQHITSAHCDSVSCGLALIKATKRAVQVVLNENGIKVDLSLGAGVHSGQVVVTRVGWMRANELTAYGSPVNHACKLSAGVNEVRVSSRVEDMYPSGPKGTLTFDAHDDYSVARIPGLIFG